MEDNEIQVIEPKEGKSSDGHDDFYQKLRAKIKAWLKTKEGSSHKWVNYLIWAPDLFHLLVKLSLDEEVPTKERAKVVAAIAYFVSPIDLLPEALLGPAGYVDDIAIAAYVLSSIVNHSGPERLRKHWAGETDVLVVIQAILKAADSMVGSGLWRRLRGRF